MPSTWGKVFKVTTFGESHGVSVGVVVEGVPGNLEFPLEEIQKDLTRRKPGQNLLTTPRKEDDEIRVVSGVFEGRTIGSPITLIVDNKNAIGRDYEKFRHIYRPSHADYTYDVKYGFRNHEGGGRASVRETIGRVAAGAIARVILEKELGLETIAWVDSIGTVDADPEIIPKSKSEVDRNDVRCPDEKAAVLMEEKIREVRKVGDSIGGTVRAAVRNVPPGLGDPVYDKLDGDLGRAILSIPACKGFEIGSGFYGSRFKGSEHNDEYYVEKETGRIRTRTNRSGGLQGGISNGEDILIRAAFKPTATISIEQDTVSDRPEDTVLKAGGRHDPCVLPRAVPIVEAAINLVLVDAYFYQRALHPEWFEKFRRKH